MASARGDALDWALALARAPGERHALRQQPLPDGMETVLQIAGGSQATVIAEAAAHAGMSPAEVVDAARFYLREMLFFPDADPYRVLGLSADASDEQVKHHHRLLQQWLHPDRPTSDWDAAFAARVNAAWSQLRTSARREAYAERVAAVAPAATSEPSWTQPARIHPVAMPEEPIDARSDGDRWRRRAPVLALFGVCAVLGVLAVRDMQREPDTGLVGTDVAASEATEAAPAVALQLPAATPPAEVAATPAPRAAQIAVAAKPVPKPAAQPVPQPVPRPAAPPAAVAVASKPVPKPIAKPVARPAAPPVAVAAAPKPKPVAAKPAVAAAVVPSPTRKPPVVVATAAPKAAPTATKAASAPPKVTTALAAPLKPAVKPTAKPVPAPAAAPPVAAVANPAPKPPIKPAPVAPPLPEPKPPVAAAPAAMTTAAAPVAASSSPAQVAQAQQTGQRLLAFVSGRGGGMPPIWANLTAQHQASGARQAMQGSGRVAVGTPDWRVGGSTAAMQASLTPAGGQARRLQVDLVWREQRWLVSGLSLEQAP
jgi:hypothetical protein